MSAAQAPPMTDKDKTPTTAEDSESEYEECLVYVETDDLRSVDAMFREEDKRRLEGGGADGQTRDRDREIEITFHKLDTDEPIMELQGIHFSGRVEDPPGTGLLFAPSSSGLPKLTSNLTPRVDPIFGVQPPAPDKEYQLVYKADKIIRMKRVHTQMDPEFEDYGYIRTFEDTSEEESGKEEGDGTPKSPRTEENPP